MQAKLKTFLCLTMQLTNKQWQNPYTLRSFLYIYWRKKTNTEPHFLGLQMKQAQYRTKFERKQNRWVGPILPNQYSGLCWIVVFIKRTNLVWTWVWYRVSKKIVTHIAVGDELTYSVCKHPCDRKDRAPDIQGQDILNPGRPNVGVERNGKT